MGVKKQATRNKPDRNKHFFSKDYNQPQPIIQGNIPLSTPAHVETAHAKLKKSFYKNSPAQRLIRSKIVPEPSANKTCYMELANHGSHNVADIHLQAQQSSLNGDILTREGLKST